MGEEERQPQSEIKPGPPDPDLRFEHNESQVEVYNLDSILSEQNGRIYDRSDFGGIIQKVSLDESKVHLNEGYSGMGLELNIVLDPLRPKGDSTSDPIETAIASLTKDNSFEEQKVRIPDSAKDDPYYKNLFYIVTNDGLRLTVHYDSENSKVWLSNNVDWKVKSTLTPIVKVTPVPLETLEGERQLESFLRVAVRVVDSIAKKQLKKTYRIGDTIRSIPSSNMGTHLGGAAVKGETQGHSSSSGGVDSTKQGKKYRGPLSELEEIFSPIDEKVRLSDVGGLESVKEELQDIALSFTKPEVMEKWGAKRPQGVLLYGEPGTGKTMLVEALANEIGADLIKIQSSDVYNMWLGESERKIKELFEGFKKIEKPTVILFDEFDAIVGITETPGPGGGGSARNSVAGIFKQEMNTLARDNPHILIVGTTNHQDRIDPSLIRSGRFDHRIYVPMPDDYGRSQIISNAISESLVEHSGEDFQVFSSDLKVPKLVELTDGISGADIAEILRRVKLSKAMREARTGHATPITQDDLVQEVQEFKQESFG